jgi:putative transposase
MATPHAPAICLSPRVEAALLQHARRYSSPHALVRRAQLILAMATGATNTQLATAFHLSRATVILWRRRWLASEAKLSAVDHLSEPALHAWVAEQLTDLPRPGAPVTFSAEQVVQIIALACKKPEECGRPISHWSPRELADEAHTRQIVSQISPRSVGRFLKSGAVTAASRRILAQSQTGGPGGVCYPGQDGL